MPALRPFRAPGVLPVEMNHQPPSDPSNDSIRATVRERYGRIPGSAGGCCGHTAAQSTGCCGSAAPSDLAAQQLGYSDADTAAVPAGSNLGLGCGNPLGIQGLRPGETVLDLGSGAGFDAFLAARAVGPTGRVIGVDMTPEMLQAARGNLARSGRSNVEFRLGEIEHLPVADATVDVILSNCVINLSPDKPAVFREAFRVLKPGGRFAVSDVVVRGEVPAAVRRSMELWVGCVAGALEEGQYRESLAQRGFEDVDIEPTRIYRAADSRQFLEHAGIDDDHALEEIDGRFMSAFIRARKPQPAAKACCDSTCCA